VLVAGAHAGREQEWSVRLPAAAGALELFVESRGAMIAVPWHRVVEFGLVPEGGGAHVLLGHGLARISLPIDRLVGRGPAGSAVPRPIAGHAPDAGDPFALPAGLAWGATVTDPGGRPARRLLVYEEHEGHEGHETPRAPAPEPVQATALPADNASVSPPPTAEGLTALVADDSMMARVFLSRLLKERGIAVDEAEDGIIAIAHLSARAYDLVFLDVAMPGAGAFEIVEASGAALAARACVLVKDEDERRRAEAFGLAPVLLKPFAEDEVAGAIGALLAARHLRG
jgi:CheY-like chemotaxis protein